MKTEYKVMQKVHLKLVFRDKPSSDLQDVFFGALRACCRAFPIDPMRRPADTVSVCNTCNGFVWHHPQGYMSPKVLKALAKQLGIRIKIISFIENCQGQTQMRVPIF